MLESNYMTIEDENESRLCLHQAPSKRSYAITGALLAIAVGAACCTVDCFLWKMAYISAFVFLGLTFFEEWEYCTIDKNLNQVQLRSISLVQKLFQTTSGQENVVLALSDIGSVSVDSQNRVMMTTASESIPYLLTKRGASDLDCAERLASKIRDFLHLEASNDSASASSSQAPKLSTQFADGAYTGGDDDSSSSDDASFERIDTAEVLNEYDNGGEEKSESGNGEGEDGGKAKKS